MLISLSTIASSLPPIAPGIGGGVLTLVQLMITLSSYTSETNPLTRSQYSKFARIENRKGDDMISSKHGMVIIYLPAFVVSLLLNILQSMTEFSYLPKQNLAGKLILFHFFKRLLEVFFLHTYSGKVSKKLATIIGIYYAFVSIIILFMANKGSNRNTLIGTVLFGIGVTGNFYHHYILSSLRKNDKEKYVSPIGGLFNYVAAPHYLFELFGWLGIAIVSSHMNVYLVFTSMASYLSGRAQAQNEWNRMKFSKKEWPSTRKNIVPFLF